jgi:hypothetical protein
LAWCYHQYPEVVTSYQRGTLAMVQETAMAVGQPGLSASSRGHSEEEMFWSCIKHRQLFWAKTPPRHCSAARASRLTHMRRHDDNARNKYVPRQQNLALGMIKPKRFRFLPNISPQT